LPSPERAGTLAVSAEMHGRTFGAILPGVDMTVAVSAVFSVLVAAVPLLAQAQSKDALGQVSLAPNAEYNANWDTCEAQARGRGTPPGTTDYGNFIENCVRGVPPR
jgi:hypothetical protein